MTKWERGGYSCCRHTSKIRTLRRCCTTNIRRAQHLSIICPAGSDGPIGTGHVNNSSKEQRGMAIMMVRTGGTQKGACNSLISWWYTNGNGAPVLSHEPKRGGFRFSSLYRHSASTTTHFYMSSEAVAPVIISTSSPVMTA